MTTPKMRLHIPKGFHVLVIATTTTIYETRFMIEDETGHKFFDKSRKGMSAVSPISEQFHFTGHGNYLSFSMEITGNPRSYINSQPMDVYNEKGELITRSITIMHEDATDADYNDQMVFITAFKYNR